MPLYWKYLFFLFFTNKR